MITNYYDYIYIYIYINYLEIQIFINNYIEYIIYIIYIYGAKHYPIALHIEKNMFPLKP